MKKLVLTLIFYTVVALIYSQAYQPLPTTNGRWCIKYNNHIIPPPPWWYTNYWETYYDGDTVIQNQTYIRITKIEYDIFCLSEIVNGPEYIGAIRDDTINRKVYLVPPGQEDEELIYDFNLLEGDTLFSYLNYGPPVYIDYIDSVLVGQVYHRRLGFQYGLGSIIEGIGSETGLLEELTIFEGGSYLCALFVDSALYYPQDSCYLETDTCLTLNIENPVLIRNFLQIFPNPAQDYILIRTLNGKYISGLRYQINNSAGIELLSGSIHDQEAINISTLSPGIYLIRLTGNNLYNGYLKMIKN
jgi:hypothetical protein